MGRHVTEGTAIMARPGGACAHPATHAIPVDHHAADAKLESAPWVQPRPDKTSTHQRGDELKPAARRRLQNPIYEHDDGDEDELSLASCIRSPFKSVR